MAANTPNNVEVKLKFSADAKQAGAAVQDLQNKTEKLAAAERKYNTASQEGQSKLEFYAKAAVAIHTITRALDGAANATKTFRNESLNASAKWGGLIEDISTSIPIFGELQKAVNKFGREILDGAAIRGLEKFREGTMISDAKYAVQQPLRDQSTSLSRQMAETADRASVLGWQNVKDGGVVRRDIDNFLINKRLGAAAEGEGVDKLLTDEKTRDAIRQALRAKQYAGYDVDVARKMATADQGRLKGYDRRLEDAENAATQAQNAIGGAKGIDKIKAVAEYEQKLVEWTRLRTEYMKDLQRANQSAVDLAQKEATLSKASLDIQRMKYQNLKDQAATAKSQETSFGMMSAGDRLSLKHAVDQAQKFGFENIDEETRSLLAGNAVTSEWAGKHAQQLGMNDPMLQQIRGMIGGGESSAQIEQQIKKLGAQIDIQIEVSEDKLRQSMFKASQDFLGEVSKMFIGMIRTEGQRIDQQVRMKKMAEAVGFSW